MRDAEAVRRSVRKPPTAADASSSGVAPEAPDGASANAAPADIATSITVSEALPITWEASSAPEISPAANDNHPADDASARAYRRGSEFVELGRARIYDPSLLVFADRGPLALSYKRLPLPH